MRRKITMVALALFALFAVTSCEFEGGAKDIQWEKVACGLGVVNLLSLVAFAWYVLKNCTDKEEVGEIVSKILGNSRRMQTMQEQIERLEATPRSGVNLSAWAQNEMERIKERLGALEGKMATKAENRVGQCEPPCTSVPKRGFAKQNSRCFFVDVSGICREESVFRIDFINEVKGEFSLLSLDKIKYSDGWEAVIDVDYNKCEMKDAKDFTVVEKGLCNKAGDDMWKVTRKLRIKISK